MAQTTSTRSPAGEAVRSLFLEQLEREAELTRRALERVPEGRNDWRPHPKSMNLGTLAHLVATMPSWIGMILNQEELDIKPKPGQEHYGPREFQKTQELVDAMDRSFGDARRALEAANPERLDTPWRLLEGEKVAQEDSRRNFIRDNFTHLAHHRGQLTVYLRMLDSVVPAIYGPSADDHRF